MDALVLEMLNSRRNSTVVTALTLEEIEILKEFEVDAEKEVDYTLTDLFRNR